jgi:hypothetical protein
LVEVGTITDWPVEFSESIFALGAGIQNRKTLLGQLVPQHDVLELFDWHDLLQEAVAHDPVPKRSINVYALIGPFLEQTRNDKTKIITVEASKWPREGTSIVVRKFWP